MTTPKAQTAADRERNSESSWDIKAANKAWSRATQRHNVSGSITARRRKHMAAALAEMQKQEGEEEKGEEKEKEQGEEEAANFRGRLW